MHPIQDTDISMDRVDDQVKPYKDLEVQFLMKQVIILDEVIESSTAAQRCQILWVGISYDVVQDLIGKVKKMVSHCHLLLSVK